MGYSRVQKGYRCYCPTLQRYLVYTDVAFSLRQPRRLLFQVGGGGGDDDLLVYYVCSPVPTPAPVPVKPPISQLYSRRQNPQTLAASSLDLVQSDDLSIALRKGKR